MINKSKLNKRSLAIIAVDVDSKEEENVMVFRGIINYHEEKLFFSRDEKNMFEISEWQESIILVKPELKKILFNCDYALRLSIGDIPKDEKSEDYIDTGLKWKQKKGS